MPEKTEKKNKSLIYIILLAILLILLIVAGYFYFDTKKQVTTLMQEKEQIRNDLQSELDSLLIQHNQVKREYGQLSDTLSVKDSIIQADAKEIKNLLNYKWEYYLIKKKLDRLRVVAQGYVHQLDSLYVVNEELKQENQRIRESYKTEKNKVSELMVEKEKLNKIVDNAAVLNAYNIQSTGIRQRGSRQTETDKARRTDRVRICFTLGENALVEPGEKTVYIRISRPDKVVLTYDKTDEYSFMYQGQKLQYSIKREIDYEGEPKDVCVYWNKRNNDEQAMEGRYHVTLYMDDTVIGESYFELR